MTDRRDLFLRLHERLIDLDLQHGRRILTGQINSSKDVEKLVGERFSDYEIVSRALSMLDLAALYVERGYVDKQMFMAEWGEVYLGLREKFMILIAERAKSDPSYMQSWRHFQALADESYGIASDR